MPQTEDMSVSSEDETSTSCLQYSSCEDEDHDDYNKNNSSSDFGHDNHHQQQQQQQQNNQNRQRSRRQPELSLLSQPQQQQQQESVWLENQQYNQHFMNPGQTTKTTTSCYKVSSSEVVVDSRKNPKKKKQLHNKPTMKTIRNSTNNNSSCASSMSSSNNTSSSIRSRGLVIPSWGKRQQQQQQKHDDDPNDNNKQEGTTNEHSSLQYESEQRSRSIQNNNNNSSSSMKSNRDRTVPQLDSTTYSDHQRSFKTTTSLSSRYNCMVQQSTQQRSQSAHHSQYSHQAQQSKAPESKTPELENNDHDNTDDGDIDEDYFDNDAVMDVATKLQVQDHPHGKHPKHPKDDENDDPYGIENLSEEDLDDDDDPYGIENLSEEDPDDDDDDPCHDHDPDENDEFDHHDDCENDLEVAKQEDRAVRFLKLFVIFLLLLVAIALSMKVYYFTYETEVQEYQDQFYHVSEQVIDKLHTNALNKLAAINSISLQIQSYAMNANLTWPNVTIPHFEQFVQATESILNAKAVMLLPVVYPHDRLQWEEYSIQNRKWVNDSYDVQQQLSNYDARPKLDGPNATWFHELWGDDVFVADDDSNHNDNDDPTFFEEYGISSKIFSTINVDFYDNTPFVENYTHTTTIPTTSTSTTTTPRYHTIYAPQWQAAPLTRYLQSTINLNYCNFDDFNRSKNVAYEQTTAVLGDLWSDYEDQGRVTTVLYPIVKEIGNVNRTVVAFLGVDIDWTTYLAGILSNGTQRIHVYVNSTCNQSFTVNLDGPIAKYSDLQYLNFSEYKTTLSVIDSNPPDLLNKTIFGQCLFGDPKDGSNRNYDDNQCHNRHDKSLPTNLSEAVCKYEFYIYPSTEFKNAYVTSKPMIYMSIVCSIFIFTILVFFVYDYLVERRQKLVLSSAQLSDAIVSSLFPTSIKDRLYLEKKEKNQMKMIENQRKKKLQQQQQKLKQQKERLLMQQQQQTCQPDQRQSNNHYYHGRENRFMMDGLIHETPYPTPHNYDSIMMIPSANENPWRKSLTTLVRNPFIRRGSDGGGNNNNNNNYHETFHGSTSNSTMDFLNSTTINQGLTFSMDNKNNNNNLYIRGQKENNENTPTTPIDNSNHGKFPKLLVLPSSPFKDHHHHTNIGCFEERVTNNGTAIADSYPEATVLFADIVGFTKWSSGRDPVDVFLLLETIYSAFDKIADRRKVFKVETIGDCYVAVTGLPKAQPDHALIMTKFANEMLSRLQTEVKTIANRLGSETLELAMRVGMHSGPVIAGVLRGAKARFQLFGDTMNTAARMESNGQKNRIHISQATADILIDKGKRHWLTQREDVIEAKGKGKMQTYWVNISGGETMKRQTEQNRKMKSLPQNRPLGKSRSSVYRSKNKCTTHTKNKRGSWPMNIVETNAKFMNDIETGNFQFGGMGTPTSVPVPPNNKGQCEPPYDIWNRKELNLSQNKYTPNGKESLPTYQDRNDVNQSTIVNNGKVNSVERCTPQFQKTTSVRPNKSPERFQSLTTGSPIRNQNGIGVVVSSSTRVRIPPFTPNKQLIPEKMGSTEDFTTVPAASPTRTRLASPIQTTTPPPPVGAWLHNVGAMIDGLYPNNVNSGGKGEEPTRVNI